jgi:hypothetical protein
MIKLVKAKKVEKGWYDIFYCNTGRIRLISK